MKAFITAFTLIASLTIALSSDEVGEESHAPELDLWGKYQELTIDDFEKIVS